MFKCDKCKKTVGPNITEIRVPTIQRKKKYPPREYKVRRNHFVDHGGVGHEIAKEKRFCPFCVRDSVGEESTVSKTGLKKLFKVTEARVMIREIEEKEE